MRGTSARLKRLLAIRRLSEELDRSTLQLAQAAVREVESALGRHEAAQTELRLAARTALCQGDRCTWLLADAQAEVAGWNLRRLRDLLSARNQAVSEAMQAFQQSRMEQEQVGLLVEAARQAERIDQDRKAQASADDWFLSRRDRTEG